MILSDNFWKGKYNSMISNWTLKNFKSIRDETLLPLSPLTIIAGTNSSGKSTVLQSILLITQTLQSRFKQQELILNGELAKLGTPENLLHFETPSDPLMMRGFIDFSSNFMSISLHPVNKSNNRTDKFEFGLLFSKNDSGFLNLTDSYFIVEEKQLNITRRSNLDQLYDFAVVNSEFEKIQINAQVRNEQFLPISYRFSKKIADEFNSQISRLSGAIDSLEWRDDPIEADFNEGLSEETKKLLTSISTRNKGTAFESFYVNLENCVSFNDILTVARDQRDKNSLVLRELKTELDRPLGRKAIEESVGLATRLVPRRIVDPLKKGLDDFRNYFENQIHYLGPLRDDPRVIYAIPNNVDFRHVGLKGEYTAAMLNLYRNEKVIYPVPSSDSPIPEIREGSLIEGVAFWLKQMGLADSVNVKELTNIGYELNINQSNMPNNLSLTNVGVGVSQVLPTLVMCLLVKHPCTLLIEQPELHLHPKVQSILGDFFLGLTYCGKQVIVETHSEHIINRLFLRIAEYGLEDENTKQLLDRIGILFVEKSGTVSKFTKVQPNEYGVILDADWPKGFLDQATLEIQKKIEAAKEKRKKRKGVR